MSNPRTYLINTHLNPQLHTISFLRRPRVEARQELHLGQALVDTASSQQPDEVRLERSWAGNDLEILPVEASSRYQLIVTGNLIFFSPLR